MKALSLWQPWATAVALRSKRIETRHWSTRYRGPLAIHAAKRLNRLELAEYQRTDHWCAALNDAFNGNIRHLREVLPFGAIVATCNLVDCRPSESFGDEIDRVQRADIGGWTERQMGNFGPERFGWVLDDIQPLATPISFKGLQGLFDVPDALLRGDTSPLLVVDARPPVGTRDLFE